MQLPQMVTIKQQFDYSYIEDVGQETQTIIQHAGVLTQITPGSRVAVGVGSRGIGYQVEVVRAVCQAIQSVGAIPFIFPAMGSHGGATSEGQRGVLRALGFHEDSMQVEILSEANGVLIGETADGIPVYVDKNALQADHLVLVNRIKPHTKFKGPLESGICKMLAVGMGKVEGATILHKSAVKFGFPHVIKTVAQQVAERLHFCFGIAILETPAKTIHSLTVLTPQTMVEQEGMLLKQATQIMARIPFAEIDLLIVDEIGKDVSGTGMDTNVIGRNRDILGTFATLPRVYRIFVRDLTEKTQGNANGIGFADFTTRRLVDKIDLQSTYKNALTAMSPEKAAIPVYLDNDRQCIAASLDSVGLTDGTDARIVRIKNTSELSQLQISQALVKQLPTTQSPKIEICGSPHPMLFDQEGNLQD